MMVEVGADPKYRRTLLRCLTLHPEPGVSQWAIDNLERSEVARHCLPQRALRTKKEVVLAG